MRNIRKIEITDDFIDNRCHELLETISGETLEWNAEAWGAVREAVEEALLDVYSIELEVVNEPRIIFSLMERNESEESKCLKSLRSIRNNLQELLRDIEDAGIDDALCAEKPKIKCPRCGMSVPDVPEDSTYDEQLCGACYDELEEQSEREA